MKSDMKKRCSQKGFTLIEAMVAIFVLTVGITAVLQIFPVGLGTEKSNQLKSQAMELAQAKTEALYSQSYDDTVVGDFLEANLEPPFENFSRQTKITYVNSNLEEAGVDQGLKKIEVKVWWQAGLLFTPREVKIVTLVAKK